MGRVVRKWILIKMKKKIFHIFMRENQIFNIEIRLHIHGMSINLQIILIPAACKAFKCFLHVFFWQFLFNLTRPINCFRHFLIAWSLIYINLQCHLSFYWKRVMWLSTRTGLLFILSCMEIYKCSVNNFERKHIKRT